MKTGVYIALIMLLFISVTGCYYDKAELVYPASQNCDTAVVRYSVEVVNILQTNCYSCHGGTAASGAGITLDNYNTVRARGLNGILLKAITHSPGASPMPKGQPKLSDCDIAKISTWINRGALNN